MKLAGNFRGSLTSKEIKGAMALSRAFRGSKHSNVHVHSDCSGSEGMARAASDPIATMKIGTGKGCYERNGYQVIASVISDVR